MSIRELLKAKTQKEIDENIWKLEPDKIMNIAFAEDDPNIAKLALKKASDTGVRLNIDETDLETLCNLTNWTGITNEYIQLLKKQKNYIQAIRVSLLSNKNLADIKKILDEADINFKEPVEYTSGNYSYADIVIRNVIKITQDFEFTKAVYNHPKIKGNTSQENQSELLKLLLDYTNFNNQLDLLLGNNKLVKESVEDVLKPKSQEEINNINRYQIGVLNHMVDIYIKDNNIKISEDIMNDITYLYASNISKIRNNYQINVPIKDTAQQIMLKFKS